MNVQGLIFVVDSNDRDRWQSNVGVHFLSFSYDCASRAWNIVQMHLHSCATGFENVVLDSKVVHDAFDE